MDIGKIKKQAGYTLIELLVAISIFSLFLAVSGTSLVDVLNLEQKANVLRKTQQGTRYILESIIREARNANGEFQQVNDIKERIDFAYKISDDNLIITSTDFDEGRVIQEVYYFDNGVVKMDTLAKSIDGDAGNNFILDSDKSNVALNDPTDLKILDFDFITGSTYYTDTDLLDVPPFMHLTIEAESERGIDSDRVELRAYILLTSSATPRSY